MKGAIAVLVKKEIGISADEIINLIEVPPQEDLGDYAFPCFGLAKKLHKSPSEIAENLAERFRKKLPTGISKIDFKGAYLNFFLDKVSLAKKVLVKVREKNYGENLSGEGKLVVIDMSSPNIAKPFGIGHLRSTIIGNSIGKIAEANGYSVIKINYLGDWGTQFGKIILAYKKWGDDVKLKKDAVSHLQDLYVRISVDESFDDEARAEFKKLEEGDKENLVLWEKFREFSLKKFEEIYNLLGVSFDVVSSESEYNGSMGGVVAELKKKKLLEKDDGAWVVDLSSDNLGVVLIQKSDGASLYATRDLAAVEDRQKKYKFDKMIYEVGQEQSLHFKQVFKILEKLGYSWAKNCVHVSHGLYLDFDGKKFSTRKGKTVYMKDIFDEVVEKAKKNLLARENLSKFELEKRALKIAIAAIFYGDLKNSRESNIIFDVDKFLSFEGDTGPYLLYSYARASSILRKVSSKAKVKISDLSDAEVRLLKKIDDLENVVVLAYESLAPNLIANFAFELSQIFNEFYHNCPVLGSGEEGFRLKLVEAFRITLKKSLGLLGIDVLEEM